MCVWSSSIVSNTSNTTDSYIEDLSPTFAAGLILSVSHRYAVFMREFLSRYITNRAYFGVSMVWQRIARTEKAVI